VVGAIVGALAGVWQKVRRIEQEAKLKLEMIQRGLPVEEMERVLRATSKHAEATGPDEEAIEELAQCLGECRASGAVIEQVLGAVQTADPAIRRAICKAVQAVIHGSEQEAKDEHILAVVRGLSRPGAPPAASEQAPSADSAPQMQSHQALPPTVAAFTAFPDSPPVQAVPTAAGGLK
jgi:hypothetical protein